MDLYEKLEKLMAELTFSIRKLRGSGEALAAAERNYKLELTKKALELREGGMAVTLIDTIIFGHPTIADLRFKRDIAKVMYEANIEHINATKLQLRLIEAQISREWGHGEHIAD